MPVPQSKAALLGRRSLLLSSPRKLFQALLLPVLYSIPAISQPVGNWAFHNTATGTGSTHNTVTAAAFGAGITSTAYNGGTEYFGEGGWPSGALNTNAYLQFSLSPNTGYELNLTDVMLRIRRSTTGSPSGSGPTAWSLRSSVDGFTTDITTGALTTTHVNFTIPLNAAFHQLYNTVTFRLYGYNASVSSGGLNRLVVDSIAVQGITTVLPLQLTGLQAEHINEKNITINWQASSIQHGTVYSVRRSVNGTDFTTINSFRETETKGSDAYSFTDMNVPADAPDVYYRIEAKEPSGWTLVSWLVKVNNKQSELALIHYTTVQGQALVASLQAPEKGTYTIRILGVNGMLLEKKTVQLQAGTNVITCDLGNMAHGTYALSVYSNRLLASKRFVY